MDAVAEGATVNVTGAGAWMSGGMDSFFERNRQNVLIWGQVPPPVEHAG